MKHSPDDDIRIAEFTASLCREVSEWTRSAREDLAGHVSAPQQSPGRLQRILNEVCDEYLGSKPPLEIQWSSRAWKRLLGCWNPRPGPQPNLIQINRIFESPDAPDWYLRYLIYHEVLHEVYPPRIENGRRRFHHRDFKRAEKEFREYREALKWEKTHVEKLYIQHRRMSA